MTTAEAFREVRHAVDRLGRELETLRDDLAIARRQADEGLSYSRIDIDLRNAGASVETASDRLVECIRGWKPLLVPGQRRLDEVLVTIRDWYPTALASGSVVDDAKRLFAQLRAHSYARMPDLREFPDLEHFCAQLGETLERLEAEA